MKNKKNIKKSSKSSYGRVNIAPLFGFRLFVVVVEDPYGDTTVVWYGTSPREARKECRHWNGMLCGPIDKPMKAEVFPLELPRYYFG